MENMEFSEFMRSSVSQITGSRITSIRNLASMRGQSTQSILPLKSGNLEKFSPALFKRWQSRYVEIKDGIFKYYKVERADKRECQGTINFDLYKCTVSI